MIGKQPNRVNALKRRLLAHETDLYEYVEQQFISQLGAIIHQVLQDRHLSQSDFADAAGMRQPDINALVRGRTDHIPTVATMRRLARALDMPLTITVSPSGGVTIRQEKIMRQDEITYALPKAATGGELSTASGASSAL